MLKDFLRLLGQALSVFMNIVFLIIALGVFAFAIGIGIGSNLNTENLEPSAYTFLLGDESSNNYLLKINVEGMILGSPPQGYDASHWFSEEGVVYGYDVQDILIEAAKDNNIKGILLSMQTPGGTIFGARAIFDGIKAYREKTGNPVVAYVQGMSASGGVMAMVGANEIYADHGSLVGSIGVLGDTLTYFNKPTAIEGGLFGGGIVTKEGIEQTIVSAGKGKDLGNPFRRPTKEELKLLQDDIDHEYDLFVKHVADNRNIEPKTIREQMGAHVFDNDAAKKYGLINGTLNYRESVKRLAELAQIQTDDYQLVQTNDKHHGLLSALLGVFRPQTVPPKVSPLKSQFCNKLSRLPLVYYGNPLAVCSP
jgi:protease IV